MSEIAALSIGYLIGSIPFGVLMARAFGLGNLRDIGSGNIGATNVLRTGNKSAAAATLICDMGKGVVAVLMVRALLGEAAALFAGFGAFLGHLFPVWLGFRGGKGVATFLGVMFAVSFLSGLLAALVWLITAAFGRISSLSALLSALLAPLWLLIFHSQGAAILGLALGVLIWIRHHENIKRLLSGTEPRIGRKK